VLRERSRTPCVVSCSSVVWRKRGPSGSDNRCCICPRSCCTPCIPPHRNPCNLSKKDNRRGPSARPVPAHQNRHI